MTTPPPPTVLMVAYLENIRESRRFLERQENRLYALLLDEIGDMREPVDASATESAAEPLQNFMNFILQGADIDAYDDEPLIINGTGSLAPTIHTELHIERATDVMDFAQVDEPMNTECPITHTDFSAGNPVMRINACGHLFEERHLRTWFRRSFRCPMCRHDIRNPVVEETLSRDTLPTDDVGVQPLGIGTTTTAPNVQSFGQLLNSLNRGNRGHRGIAGFHSGVGIEPDFLRRSVTGTVVTSAEIDPSTAPGTQPTPDEQLTTEPVNSYADIRVSVAEHPENDISGGIVFRRRGGGGDGL